MDCLLLLFISHPQYHLKGRGGQARCLFLSVLIVAGGKSARIAVLHVPQLFVLDLGKDVVSLAMLTRVLHLSLFLALSPHDRYSLILFT